MKKRVFTVLSACIVLLLFIYTACSDKDITDNTSDTQKSTSEIPDETDEVTSDEDGRYSRTADVKKLDGYIYRIYGCAPNEGDDWHVHDMIAEETKAETLNDAVYDRNLFLDETYGFTFELTESLLQDPYNEIYNMVAAGDTTYDDFCIHAYTAGSLSKSGVLRNLYDLPYLDFEESYWSPSLLNPLVIDKKLYMATGDISVVQKEGIRGFYFNKTLVDDLKLEVPYDLVKNGTWTYDKMFSLAEEATSDLNGDSLMNDSDRYGIMAQGILGMVLYQGSGESMIGIDKETHPYISVTSDRSIESLIKISDLLSGHKSDMYISGDWRRMLTLFDEGKALFYSEVMLHIETMRGFDVEFGIIPTPKFSEDQEEYYHFIDSGCNYFHTIPTTLSDERAEQAAYILEVTAAASKHYVNPAYYEVCLKSKYSRDVESSEMLDIIFGSYRLEVANVYGWGNLFDGLNNCMMSGANISSTIAALEKLTQKAMDKSLESFAENNKY